MHNTFTQNVSIKVLMFKKLRSKISATSKIWRTKGAVNVSSYPYVSLIVGESPKFSEYNSPKMFEAEYEKNPVLSSAVDLRASYLSNAQFNVKNLKNGELITYKDFRKIKNPSYELKKMFQLVYNPNPLQSRMEFLTLVSIMHDVFGNSFIRANTASSTGDVNIRDVGTLFSVWPQYMTPILTGKYWDATDEKDIIKGWKWKWLENEKKFSADEILHRKEPNLKLNQLQDWVLGESKIISLSVPLSNIRIAYESRNVIARERGMRGIITSDMKDGQFGSIALEEDEKKTVQDDFKEKYGFREGQNQFYITGLPIKYYAVEQDVRKLGLLDEIASDAMIVLNKFGIPEVLGKLYLEGATFENQESSERRMYQNTTIPFAEDFADDLNDWLKTRDFDFEYQVSFSHLPVLQQSYKDKAIADKNMTVVMSKLFLTGGCTYNDWLKAMKMEQVNEAWADKRITEMSDREIMIITGNYNPNKNAG